MFWGDARCRFHIVDATVVLIYISSVQWCVFVYIYNDCSWKRGWVRTPSQNTEMAENERDKGRVGTWNEPGEMWWGKMGMLKLTACTNFTLITCIRTLRPPYSAMFSGSPYCCYPYKIVAATNIGWLYSTVPTLNFCCCSSYCCDGTSLSASSEKTR